MKSGKQFSDHNMQSWCLNVFPNYLFYAVKWYGGIWGHLVLDNQTLTRICFLCETWCLPPYGVMQFCTVSQVLVQQRGKNLESK